MEGYTMRLHEVIPLEVRGCAVGGYELLSWEITVIPLSCTKLSIFTSHMKFNYCVW